LVGVARAIIAQPKLLPVNTGNLHSGQGEESRSSSMAERARLTIVQVTHSEKNASYGKRHSTAG
jgi:ABC-type lipoprotein export system ATPase subunit